MCPLCMSHESCDKRLKFVREKELSYLRNADITALARFFIFCKDEGKVCLISIISDKMSIGSNSGIQSSLGFRKSISLACWDASATVDK